MLCPIDCWLCLVDSPFNQSWVSLRNLGLCWLGETMLGDKSGPRMVPKYPVLVEKTLGSLTRLESVPSLQGVLFGFGFHQQHYCDGSPGQFRTLRWKLNFQAA